MTFQWTEERIRFMEDASRISLYFPRLAERLLPYLEGCKTICDAGCGLGQLSMELGKHGLEVTAADLSPEAIRYVEKQHYQNVKTLCTDLLENPPEKKFDAMVFHYFGSIQEILSIGEKLCSGPILVVKKNYYSHRFTLEKKPILGYTAQSAERILQERGISYRKELFQEEMGQPFRTLDDAVRFYEIYSRDEDKTPLSRETIQERLLKREDKEFPYYLPQQKDSMILVLGTKETA